MTAEIDFLLKLGELRKDSPVVWLGLQELTLWFSAF